MQNIVAAIFKTESEGYQAITELRHYPITDKAAILQMALVKRTQEGFVLCDGYDAGVLSGGGAMMGGLLGGLLGILGGPLGVLMMSSWGTLAGHLAGTADELDLATLIEKVASKMVEGEISLIVLAEEKEEGELDARLGKFDVMIARFDAAVIADEVEEAEKIEAENDRKALEDFHERMEADRQAKVEARRAEIDANFEKYYADKVKNASAYV